MTFNPKEHLMQISKKDYLPVAWRLVWFREECPNGTIDTEEIEVDLDREVQEEIPVWSNEKRRMEKVTKTAKGYARFRAVITDGKGGRATGTKSENAASFPDFIEKAETGSIGRALAALGYGTQFAPELDEGQRIADAPVQRSPYYSNDAQDETSNSTNEATKASSHAPTPINKVSAQSVVSESHAQTNLNDIPSARKLREIAAALGIEWSSVLEEAFERPIAEGKVTLQALENKGDDLPPGYCKRIASYLQTKQAA